MSDCTDLVFSIIPLHQIIKMIWLSMACGAISMVITKSTLLNKFHAWLQKSSPFLEEMLSCPWCTSHWVAAALVFIYQPEVMYGLRPAWSYLGVLGFSLLFVDFFITVMIMVVMSAVVARIIYSAYKPMME